MQVYLTLLAAAVISLATALVGGWQTFQQHQALRNYVQTSGQVIEVGQAPVQLGRGRFRPPIRYRYHVNGQPFESDRLTPLSYFGDQRWATETLASFALYETTPVYYDPAAPSRAYVIRRAAFWPYLLLLTSAGAWLAVLLPLARGGVLDRPPFALKCNENDWYHVRPNCKASSWVSRAGLAALMWYCYGAVMLGHYALVGASTGDLFRPTPMLVAGAYVLLGIAPIRFMFLAMRQSETIQTPELLTTLAEPTIDRPVIARVRIQTLSETPINEITAALVCLKRNGLHSEEWFSQTISLTHSIMLRPNEIFDQEVTFEIPPKKQRAGSKFNRWEYPRIDWRINVTVKTEAGPVFVTRFPIRLPVPESRDSKKSSDLRLAV